MNPLIAKFLPYAGWPLAAFTLWLYIGAREDVAQQIELCNTQKITAVAEAERVARESLETAMAIRSQRLREIAEQEQSARLILQDRIDELESKPAEIREVIRSVADENVCIDAVVPAAIVDSLRSE